MVRFHGDLEPLMRPVDSVTPAPYNYNNGDVELVAESIEQVGMYRPIYAQLSTGHIIAGNHTWLAVQALGARECPIVFLDCDDTTARRIMVADNEIAKKAKPDTGLLEDLLQKIKDAQPEIPLDSTGVTDEEFAAIKALNDIPLNDTDFGTWPSFEVRLPPHVMAAFMAMTEDADEEWKRIEMLMRMAGWENS
jgi:hypothetical protein